MRKTPTARCKVCGAQIAVGGPTLSHLKGHGITRDSDDATVAAAIQAWKKLQAYRIRNRA